MTREQFLITAQVEYYLNNTDDPEEVFRYMCEESKLVAISTKDYILNFHELKYFSDNEEILILCFKSYLEESEDITEDCFKILPDESKFLWCDMFEKCYEGEEELPPYCNRWLKAYKRRETINSILE